ncbi:MAG TPA: hypothetical protein DEF72_06000 [Gammaproteobacteria bacterium]|nr:hypothetical protein [Gammaproteobacteria bacterium]
MISQLITVIGFIAMSFSADASSISEEPKFSQPDSRSWVVMVTQPDCSFCVRLEKEILQPLRASGEFREKIRFTTVDIGIAAPLTDFDGTKTTTVAFASRYEGFGTPTLLFLSPRGDPLAPPKYGVPDIIDFYAYEIEETIRNLPPAN